MRINFFGDVCLHGIDPPSFALDPDLVALAESADCNVANLECPLTDATRRRPYKTVHLKAPPVENPILDLLDVFTLANNHTLDYQADGLHDTVRFLRGYGKQYFGVGDNRRLSFEPLRVTLDGHRIAFLGCSPWHAATRCAPGGTPMALRPLTQVIHRLAADGYFVVVYPHWNYEYVDFPAPANRRFAHRLIDAGAHLIVGSHPHVFQGVEEYRGRYVFHSLGNFVFAAPQPDKGADSRANETLVLTIELGKSHTYDFRVVPVLTSHRGVTVPQGAQAERVRERFEELSRALRDEQRYEPMFYAQASEAARYTTREIQTMVQKQGVMYLLSRLHHVTLQDLKIKLHAARMR